jgi:hypothetical protein
VTAVLPATPQDPTPAQEAIWPALISEGEIVGGGEGSSSALALPAAPQDTTKAEVGDKLPLIDESNFSRHTTTKEHIRELRRIARNAATADVHTLHKVERVAAKKNVEAGISFSSFPDSKIIFNLGRVGINLGTSDIAVIKNIEVDRLILCANQKKEKYIKIQLPYFRQ